MCTGSAKSAEPSTKHSTPFDTLSTWIYPYRTMTINHESMNYRTWLSPTKSLDSLATCDIYVIMKIENEKKRETSAWTTVAPESRPVWGEEGRRWSCGPLRSLSQRIELSKHVSGSVNVRHSRTFRHGSWGRVVLLMRSEITSSCAFKKSTRESLSSVLIIFPSTLVVHHQSIQFGGEISIFYLNFSVSEKRAREINGSQRSLFIPTEKWWFA